MGSKHPGKIQFSMIDDNRTGVVIHVLRRCAEELMRLRNPRAALLAVCAFRFMREQHPEDGFGDVYFTDEARDAWAREFVQVYERNALLEAERFKKARIDDGWFDLVADWGPIHRRIKRFYALAYPDQPPVPSDYWWPSDRAEGGQAPTVGFHDGEISYLELLKEQKPPSPKSAKRPSLDRSKG